MNKNNNNKPSVMKLLMFRNMTVIMILTIIPATVALLLFYDYSWIVRVIYLLYLTVFSIINIIIYYQKCPKCNQLFFIKNIWKRSFASRCVHCGYNSKDL